jgi:hypothetical protein
LGAALLRQLAGGAQVAETEALREVRRHNRSPLGRHRCILQTREQSLARRLPSQLTISAAGPSFIQRSA